MVYTVMNVCINPGRSWEGIEQLKALARWLTDKYGAETTLLGSGSAVNDRKQLVTRFQSPAQMREIDRRLVQDTEFAAWLRRSEALVRWDCAPGAVYQVMDQ